MRKWIMVLVVSGVITFGFVGWLYLNKQYVNQPTYQSTSTDLSVEVASEHPQIHLAEVSDQDLWREFLEQIGLSQLSFVRQVRPGFESYVVEINPPVSKLRVVFTDTLLSNNIVTQDPKRQVVEQASQVDYDTATQTMTLQIYINPNFLNLPDRMKQGYLNQAVAFMVTEAVSHRFISADSQAVDNQTQFINTQMKFINDKFSDNRRLIQIR